MFSHYIRDGEKSIKRVLKCSTQKICVNAIASYVANKADFFKFRKAQILLCFPPLESRTFRNVYFQVYLNFKVFPISLGLITSENSWHYPTKYKMNL